MSVTIARGLACALLLLSSSTALAGPGRAVGQECDGGARELLSRQFSGVGEARLEILDDLDEWCDLWDEAHSIFFPRPPCDPSLVDFSTEVVVVASLGPRPDTCHSVDIPCVQALGESGHVRIHVSEVSPGPSCPCGAAIVNPIVAVAIPIPDEPIQWRVHQEELDCR